MKKLVIFSTLTGNTEKIANAIFSVIEGDKELLNVKDSDKINPDDYEKIIVGYWVDKGDADEKIKAFMSKINNKTVATFGTLGAKADSDHAKKCMAAVREFLEANGNKVEREKFDGGNSSKRSDCSNKNVDEYKKGHLIMRPKLLRKSNSFS